MIRALAVLLIASACDGQVGALTGVLPSTPAAPLPTLDPAPSVSVAIEAAGAAPGAVDAGHPEPDAGHPIIDAGHSGDAGIDANPTAWLFTEDFEHGLDAGTWSLTQQGATVKLDTVHAAGGTHALHAHANNVGQNTGFAVTTQRFALAGQDTFIRAYVYIETPLTHHAQIIRLWHAWADGEALEILWNGSEHRLNFFETWYYQHTSSEPNDVQYTSSGVPTGGWHCWEWEINAKTNQLQLWLDEVPVTDANVPGSRNWTSPVDSQLSIGWSHFHDEPATPNGFDTWIDDVVVSRARIGCAH